MEVRGTSPASAGESAFSMVDVGEKPITFRRAVATGVIRVGREVFQRIVGKTVPKGDVLALAEVAGIQAAKRTADLLPLCHPLAIERASVALTLGEDGESVRAVASVCGHGKTGFEMEALTATSAALLCVYDLTKALNPELTITDVTLVEKEGGKSGHWKRNAPPPPDSATARTLEGVACAILTVSDRVSRGLATDGSGPVLRELVEACGASVVEQGVVADDKEAITAKVREWAARARVILLTGGTGLGPRDVTPEAIATACDRLIPGFGERLRADGAKYTELSYLSRSTAGLVGGTLVIALPGSVKAVRQGMAALEKLLPHALHVASGGDHARG